MENTPISLKVSRKAELVDIFISSYWLATFEEEESVPFILPWVVSQSLSQSELVSSSTSSNTSGVRLRRAPHVEGGHCASIS